MNLAITSASGNILTAEKFARVTLMTESGEITVLPGHEGLISAIRPGIMSVEYFVWNKIHTAEYATGGGVLSIDSTSCTVIVDVVHTPDKLTDIEYIVSQKKEAEEFIKTYQKENGTTIDPHKLIELEYELLKYTAMHHLGQKFHDVHAGARK
jgi:F0F1-type ATP synthase epsilon subunit